MIRTIRVITKLYLWNMRNGGLRGRVGLLPNLLRRGLYAMQSLNRPNGFRSYPTLPRRFPNCIKNINSEHALFNNLIYYRKFAYRDKMFYMDVYNKKNCIALI